MIARCPIDNRGKCRFLPLYFSVSLLLNNVIVLLLFFMLDSPANIQHPVGLFPAVTRKHVPTRRTLPPPRSPSQIITALRLSLLYLSFSLSLYVFFFSLDLALYLFLFQPRP